MIGSRRLVSPSRWFLLVLFPLATLEAKALFTVRASPLPVQDFHPNCSIIGVRISASFLTYILQLLKPMSTYLL